MDMKDQFWEARNWVKDELSFDNAGSVSVFETTIRELGGLLSAYDLSEDEVFKQKVRSALCVCVRERGGRAERDRGRESEPGMFSMFKT